MVFGSLQIAFVVSEAVTESIGHVSISMSDEELLVEMRNQGSGASLAKGRCGRKYIAVDDDEPMGLDDYH